MTTLVDSVVVDNFATSPVADMRFRGGDLAFLACDTQQVVYGSSLPSGTAAFFTLDITNIATPVFNLITQNSTTGAAGIFPAG